MKTTFARSHDLGMYLKVTEKRILDTEIRLPDKPTFPVPLPSGFGTAPTLGFPPKAEGTVLLDSVFTDKVFQRPSNTESDNFQCWLDALEDAIFCTEGRILVKGYFNASALESGMPPPDSKKKRILEIAAKTGLVFNTSNPPQCSGAQTRCRHNLCVGITAIAGGREDLKTSRQATINILLSRANPAVFLCVHRRGGEHQQVCQNSWSR